MAIPEHLIFSLTFVEKRHNLERLNPLNLALQINSFWKDEIEFYRMRYEFIEANWTGFSVYLCVQKKKREWPLITKRNLV